MASKTAGYFGTGAAAPPPSSALVSVDGADLTADFLAAKVAAGANVALTVLNPGGSEQLRIAVASAPPSGAAGGDLGGTYPNPTVVALEETSGPTRLPLGGVADGQFLKRVGASLVGATAQLGGFLDNGNSGAAKLIDWTVAAYQKVTLNAAAPVLTFTAPAAAGQGLVLFVAQDATGGRLPVLPATVQLAGGTRAALNLAPLSITELRLTWTGAAYPSQLAVGSSDATRTNVTVTGSGATATGGGTTASGSNSVAEGLSTTASGPNAHSQGSSSVASGAAAYAGGTNCVASGSNTSARGHASVAAGEQAFASGDTCGAYGDNSFATGLGTATLGHQCASEGRLNQTWGPGGHSEGVLTTSTGEGAHSEGRNGTAGMVPVPFTVPAGGTLVTMAGDQTLFFSAPGLELQVNRTTPAQLASITAANVAAGVFAAGNTTFTLTGALDGTTTAGQIVNIQFGDSAHVEGNGASIASGTASHVEGTGPSFASGAGAHAEGHTTTASANYAHAQGDGCVASGLQSDACGSGSTASGPSSHAGGVSSQATVSAAWADGQLCQATATNAHAEGRSTTASGVNSHAEGFNSVAGPGEEAHCEGLSSTASGAVSHAEGFGCTASGDRSHAEGNTSLSSGADSHCEGSHGTSSGAQAHAGGNNSVASGVGAFAHGLFCTASADYAVAIGYVASATRKNRFVRAGGNIVATSGDCQTGYDALHGVTPGLAAGETCLLLPSSVATLVLDNNRKYRITLEAIATQLATVAAASVFATFNQEFVAAVRSNGTVDLSAVNLLSPQLIAGAAFVGATLVPTTTGANNLSLTFAIAGGLTVVSRIACDMKAVEIVGT